jgi:UPF0755 protein
MKKILFLLVAVFIVAIVLIGGIAVWLWQPVSNQATAESVKVIIPKGASVSKIADLLYEQKLIKHPLFFRVVARVNNLETNLQAGSFELSPNLTSLQIAEKLTQGTQDTWIRILEGWRREEIADYLGSQELATFSKADFLTQTATLEGKLYPDSYLVPKEITTTAIINLLTNTHKQKVIDAFPSEIAASSLTPDEIVILASILEREAQGKEQMRRVAGILFNRLEIGMPLQVDASLQYINGYSEAQQSWWVPPTAQDKQLNSPFNTYANTGLPPKAISNPGQVAIEAVLDPQEVDDLFYLHAPDGSIHYAQTLDGHNANVNRYLR